MVQQGSMKVQQLHHVEEDFSRVAGNGYITSSTLTIESVTSDLLLECYASHIELGEQNLAYAHVVSVISE